MQQRMAWTAVVAVCIASGCVFVRPAAVPLPLIHHAAATDSPHGLIVMLPGLGGSPEDFEDYGFVDLVRRDHPDYDVLVADAHFGYYRTRTLVDRLHEDVIGPRRAAYDEIWILGTSLGGFGALVYASEHVECVNGLILLAPYLGTEAVAREVADAGGLATWSAPEGWRDAEDSERRATYQIWTWLRGYADATESRPGLFLGYGSEDGLSVPGVLLADVLPPEQKEITAGGHKFVVWRPIFKTLLPRALGTSARSLGRPDPSVPSRAPDDGVASRRK